MENKNKPKGQGFFSRDGKLNKFLNKYGVAVALAGCALVVGFTWYATYKGGQAPSATPTPSAKGLQTTQRPTDSGGSSALDGSTPRPAATPTAAPGGVGPAATTDMEPSSTKSPGSQAVSAPVLLRPVPGAIIKKFTVTELLYSKTLNQWATHSGVDMAVGVGDDIMAALGGTVESVYKDALMGECVLIKYDEEISLLYCGLLSTENLHEGKEFRQGEVIGQAGGVIPCESLDEPHLHFELIQKGSPADPAEYWQ